MIHPDYNSIISHQEAGCSLFMEYTASPKEVAS